ncbi:hypothetical protein DFR49_3626 [Hephaestia caeni]|uniref:Uncharacterized protein n=1 Tax=Hephaestia caeni TaxID=645617 RepID=A0A397NMX2_9SPHN|nr:hypothetical protein [Hephaestia caeni]RIA37738.1 hypothetical protein DFR49_3626 [Hephaestia caeni]
MALKDLKGSVFSVSEDLIEDIVRSYVRYDSDEKSIVMTPEAASLSNKVKVLVYLTANEGWPYVIDDYTVQPLAPKDMEAPLGMKGGSLRPTLRALEADNFIRKMGSGYRVIAANLAKVKSHLGSGK